MSFKEDTIKFKDMDQFKVKCKCSHTIIIARADRCICSYCGNWIYRTPQLEFKYKIKEMGKRLNAKSV